MMGSARAPAVLLLAALGLARLLPAADGEVSAPAPALKAPARGPAPGAAWKPSMAIAFSSVEVLQDRLRFLLDLCGQGAMRRELDNFLSRAADAKGIPGVDPRRHLGCIVQGNGKSTRPLFFVPIKNTKSFLDLVSRFFPGVKESAPGKFQLQGEASMFLRVAGSWAFVGPAADQLDLALLDPVALVAPEGREHDLSFTIHLDDLPEATRQALRTQLQDDVLQSAVRMPGESEAEFTGRMQSGQLINAFGTSLLAEGHRIAMSLDCAGDAADAADSAFELGVVCRSGSQLADDLRRLLAGSSRFGALQDPDAAFSLAAALPRNSMLAQSARATIGILKEKVRQFHQATMERKIEKREELTRSWRGLTKLVQLVDDAVQTGDLDFLAQAREDSAGNWTYILAAALPNLAEVEAWVRENLPMYRDLGALSRVSLDLASYKGVRIHGAHPTGEKGAPPPPASASPALCLGFDGKDRLYVVFGKGGLPALRGLIDHQRSPAAQRKLPAVDLYGSLESTLRWRDNAVAATAAPVDPKARRGHAVPVNAAASSPLPQEEPQAQASPAPRTARGSGRFHLVLEPSTNGARLRCEFDSDVLRALGRRVAQHLSRLADD